MDNKLKITAKLEIADHDGYCSDFDDNEGCEYEVKIVESIYPIHQNDDLYAYPLGDVDLTLENFVHRLNDPKMKCQSPSCVCGRSKECKNAELNQHEYRYTIQRVEIIV